MKGYLKNILRVVALLGCWISLFYAAPAGAWTSAHLFNVSVTVDLASSGPSTVTTDARFVVEAGYFHGFDFAALPGAKLDKSQAVAFQDDQREYPVTFKKVHGKIRVLLADDKYVRGGGITFRLVHKIDFAEVGALRSKGGRARFDWTPLVWDVGLDNMRVAVRLPEANGSTEIRVDGAVAKDYVSTVSENQVSFIKFRPVKWYPMRVAADFDAALISDLPVAEPEPEKSDATASAPAAAATALEPPSDGTPPFSALVIFAAVCLLGWIVSVLKARHICLVHRAVGSAPVFRLLQRTSLRIRALLALIAVAIGGTVQIAGYAAAGIPLFITAAALFLVKAGTEPQRLRPGGTWREMTNADIEAYASLYAAYRRSRSSMLDITTVKGAALFLLLLGALLFSAVAGALRGTETAFLSLVDGALLLIPAWFSAIRSELPVDTTMEGFGLLRKWRKSLAKLIGTKNGPAETRFFVREDETGPIEVRLRAHLPIEGLRNIETAAEEFTAGTVHRIRTVFVLRMEPGAPVTRKLAACPHAAEHHLTPDLQEEIIVLRNRRGKTASGLSPLRVALHQIS